MQKKEEKKFFSLYLKKSFQRYMKLPNCNPIFHNWRKTLSFRLSRFFLLLLFFLFQLSLCFSKEKKAFSAQLSPFLSEMPILLLIGNWNFRNIIKILFLFLCMHVPLWSTTKTIVYAWFAESGPTLRLCNIYVVMDTSKFTSFASSSLSDAAAYAVSRKN